MKAIVQEQATAAGIDANGSIAEPFEYMCRQLSEQNI
jgi:hypothetical protein